MHQRSLSRSRPAQDRCDQRPSQDKTKPLVEGDRGAGGLPEEALLATQHGGLELIELKRLEGSLEDVFVELVGRGFSDEDAPSADATSSGFCSAAAQNRIARVASPP